MGLKRETWCHFGKAWCHFLWFDWIACLLFCFCFFCLAVLLGCVSECLLLYLLLFLRTVFSLYQPVTLLNLQRCIFSNIPIFVLTPSSLPFLSPPSSYSAEGSVCQSRHSCFEAGETNYHKLQKYSLHQLPALKAPLPLTHPAGDWGVRYLTDQEYWELHRTL